MAQVDELAINAITARPGLVTKRQRAAPTPETLAESADSARLVGDLAHIFQRSRASALRHRDRNPLFVNIQANKSGMLHLARLLCMRHCAGHPAEPSYRCISDGGPPAAQAIIESISGFGSKKQTKLIRSASPRSVRTATGGSRCFIKLDSEQSS